MMSMSMSMSMKVHVSSLHAPIYKNFYNFKICAFGEKLKIKISNAQIEIFINWCMEGRHMNEPNFQGFIDSHYRFLQFWFFFL